MKLSYALTSTEIARWNICSRQAERMRRARSRLRDCGTYNSRLINSKFPITEKHLLNGIVLGIEFIDNALL